VSFLHTVPAVTLPFHSLSLFCEKTSTLTDAAAADSMLLCECMQMPALFQNPEGGGAQAMDKVAMSWRCNKASHGQLALTSRPGLYCATGALLDAFWGRCLSRVGMAPTGHE
jgi:hypothetical protein